MGSRIQVVDDQRSFDDFFAEFARHVAAIVALSTGDPGLAEDATQEAMARAHARWSRVGKLDRPDLWVIRVAGNIAIDSWRRRRREVALSGSANTRDVPDHVRVLWLRWAMEQMSPEDRLLLILRHVYGLSIDEIGVTTHRSPHTVTTYLKRARRRLRSLLSEGDA